MSTLTIFNAKKGATVTGDFAQDKSVLVQHSRLLHSVLGAAGWNYTNTRFNTGNHRNLRSQQRLIHLLIPQMFGIYFKPRNGITNTQINNTPLQPAIVMETGTMK